LATFNDQHRAAANITWQSLVLYDLPKKQKKITAEPNVGRQEADQSEMKKESPISKS